MTGASVRAYPDGPFLLRGEVRIEDEHGNEVQTGKVAALCRCGRSRIQPLCDGLHAAGGGLPVECERRSRVGDLRSEPAEGEGRNASVA